MVNCPPGYRWTLIAISENKRWLSTNIPAELRLRMLEFFDRCTDSFLTAEARRSLQRSAPRRLPTTAA